MAMFSFTKMHGLGNDFIITQTAAFADALSKSRLCAEARTLSALSRRLCDRRTGIGADGLILVCPAEAPEADIRMRIFNSDGSEAQMCGNGIRCFAHYAYERGLAPARMRVETLAGLREAVCDVAETAAHPRGSVQRVAVDMGKPEFLSEGMQSIQVLGRTFAYRALLLGVPHAVVPVEDPTEAELMRCGAAMEWASPFPNGTNVDFIKVLDRGNILMRVWERGCGETLCCGTGATASAACMHAMGLVDAAVQVHLRLGALEIDCMPDGSTRMCGPAAFVFEGEMEL